jgi:hypothetical protein
MTVLPFPYTNWRLDFVAVCCEYGNESSVSMKGGEFSVAERLLALQDGL